MSIDDALKGIGTAAKDAVKALEEFSEAKKNALKAKDYDAVRQITELEKVTRKLTEAKLKEASAVETLLALQAKSGSLTEEEIKLYGKAEAVINDLSEAQETLKNKQVDLTTARKKARASLLASNRALLENWKATTKAGKAYGLMSSGLGRMTAGLTIGGLAMKALGRFTDAAQIKQQIMIQNFKGFNKGLDGTTQSAAASVIETKRFADALVDARVAAYRMGVPVGQVNETMVDFARITGNSTPEALGKLTAATITVSKTLGIAMPEAVDFVKNRMDKFGGTAASAVIAMNNIRVNTENVNKMFGRTVVRADDIARSLMEVSRQTNVYAIDQRMVAGMLRENIVRLQSTGDSYELASRKAKLFADAMVGQDRIPEFMKVLAGGKILKGMNNIYKNLGAKGALGVKAAEDWEEQYGAALDAAAPGLNKKVQDILGDKDLGGYAKLRQIQELTKGTTIGMEAMGDELLKFEKGEGVTVLAKQMGISFEEASGLVKQARIYKDNQVQVNKLMKGSVADVAKALGVHESVAATMVDQNASAGIRKQQLHEALRVTKEVAMAEQAVKDEKLHQEIVAKRIAGMQKGKDAIEKRIVEIVGTPQFEKLHKTIQAQTAELNAMGPDDEGREALEEKLSANKEELAGIKDGLTDAAKKEVMKLDAMSRNMDETIAQQKKKGDKDDLSNLTMEELTRKNMTEQLQSSVERGDIAKETFESLSRIEYILGATLAWHLGGKFAKGLASKLSKGDGILGPLWKKIGGFFGKGGGGGSGKAGGKIQGPPKPEIANALGKTPGGKLADSVSKASNIKPEAPKAPKGGALKPPTAADAANKIVPKTAKIVPKTPAIVPKESKGLFSSFKGMLKSGMESVKGFAAKGIKTGGEIASKAAGGLKDIGSSGFFSKILKPLKFLGKAFGLALTPILVALEDFKNILQSIKDGDFVETAIRAIPAITATAGGALGGAAGGAAGTLALPVAGTVAVGAAGAIAGSRVGQEFGNWARDALLEMRDDPQDKKKKEEDKGIKDKTDPSSKKVEQLLTEQNNKSDAHRQLVASNQKKNDIALASKDTNKSLTSTNAINKRIVDFKAPEGLADKKAGASSVLEGGKVLKFGAPQKTKPVNMVKNMARASLAVKDSQGNILTEEEAAKAKAKTKDKTNESANVETEPMLEDGPQMAQVESYNDSEGSVLIRVDNFKQVVQGAMRQGQRMRGPRS